MDLNSFIEEDLRDGDITSESLFTDEVAAARIVVHEDCVLAGVEEARTIFETLGARPDVLCDDGERVRCETVVMRIDGPAKAILGGERTALNFLMRLSGIATFTSSLVDRCKALNPKVEVAATRKTTPGFRAFEKEAVELGGGIPHRYGLYDAVMIKDNHIKVVGGIEECMRRMKASAHRPIEIEVETTSDAEKAAKLGADIIMLDNFTPEAAASAYERIKAINPNIQVEISGGITPESIENYARCADVISLGRLTYSVKGLDFSLDVD